MPCIRYWDAALNKNQGLLCWRQHPVPMGETAREECVPMTPSSTPRRPATDMGCLWWRRCPMTIIEPSLFKPHPQYPSRRWGLAPAIRAQGPMQRPRPAGPCWLPVVFQGLSAQASSSRSQFVILNLHFLFFSLHRVRMARRLLALSQRDLFSVVRPRAQGISHWSSQFPSLVLFDQSLLAILKH